MISHRRNTIAALCLLGTAGSSAAGIDTATVDRGSAGYVLSWQSSPRDQPVDIFVAERPDAAREKRNRLIEGDRDGTANVQPVIKSRPYFYVTTQDGAGMWTAERLLPLEGGRNFRDLGGYQTADGKRVKWGKLYRSGTMAHLTTNDYEYLGKLGIRVVCDFRSTQERATEPNKWQEVAGLDYWSRDYAATFGELRKLLASNPTGESAKAAMASGYRELPFEQALSYRELFKRLAANEVPLAFNCSAGKDRAGTAAALILSALGVPRDIVVEDYALSDKLVDFRAAYTSGNKDGRAGAMAQMQPEVVQAVLSSDPDYIRAALDEIESRHGTIEGYLRDVLGIDTEELAAIRRELLE